MRTLTTPTTTTTNVPHATFETIVTRQNLKALTQPNHRREGVFANHDAPLAQRVLTRVPELASWKEWYPTPPLYLRNGHVMTIAASLRRTTRPCSYHRRLLTTPDGGTLALDFLVACAPRADVVGAAADAAATAQSPAVAGSYDERCQASTVFTDAPPPLCPSKPFLLLISGLGGGSQDTYVRSMAAAAAERGWQVACLNMRACGDSPVTSPRFFSAHRGSTCDVRHAIATLRREGRVGGPLAIVGWSNGGSIVNNYLAECATSHPEPEYSVGAAASLVCPLDMVVGSNNLKRWFHRATYDRSIGSNLGRKFKANAHLFVGPAGESRPVPRWEGLARDGAGAGTFVANVELGSRARTVREIDEAVTRRCFGFETVDEYYAHASSDQRLPSITTPTLLLSAADDPISPASGIPWHAAYDNPNLLLATTRYGGHLGWCERSDLWGEPAWSQRATIGFLEAALNLDPEEVRERGCEVMREKV